MQVLYQLSYGPNDVEIALEQSFVVGTLHCKDPLNLAPDRDELPLHFHLFCWQLNR